MKLFKTHYRFDPETLSYHKIDRDIFTWVYKTLIPHSAVALILGFGLSIVFSYYWDAPKISRLKDKEVELLANYDLFSEKLLASISKLSEVQNHDDNIYRVIFEQDPIPGSVRQSGYGGINKYKGLEGHLNSNMVILNNVKLDKFEKQLVVQSKSFDDIVKLVIDKERMLASIPAIQPIAIKDLTRFGSPYGWRFHPILHIWRMHDGVDLTAPTGTKVHAAGDGVISLTEHGGSGYGNQIRINHGYGYTTRYGHLSKILVNLGDHVKRGDVIGLVGSTGLSTAPHLHYEVRIFEKSVNPINYYFNDLSPEEYEKVIKLGQDSTTHSFSNEEEL